MANPQSLTFNYNGVEITGRLVDGRVSFTIAVDSPAASTDGDPQAALDLTKILGQAAKLLPLLAAILTGGFTPALLPAIFQTIADLFGVSLEQAQSMLVAPGVQS